MWPGLQAVASKFQDKPVLFLAVNSGTPRAQLQSYLRKNRVRWPAIADTDRTFERSCGVPTISLQNIYQVRIMKPDGKLVATSPTRMEQTLAGVVGAAKWNVDPEGIPSTLKKAGNSRKPETKQGATKLLDYVGEKMNKQIKEAKAAKADGKAWLAFRGYSDAAVRYKGYDLPKDITATIQKLKADPDVKTEMTSLRILAAAKRKLYGKTVGARKSGYRSLERLAEQQPDTQAGQEAQRLVNSLGM